MLTGCCVTCRYSFVLTGAQGSRRYGLCLRYRHNSVWECMVIITQHNWLAFFADIVETARGIRCEASGRETVERFLKRLRLAPVPRPGDVVQISLADTESEQLEDLLGGAPALDMATPVSAPPREYEFSRPDSYGFSLEADYGPLVRCLGTAGLITLLEALLGESRVIMHSADLRRLSICTQVGRVGLGFGSAFELGYSEG